MSAGSEPGREFRHGLVVGKFYPPHAGHHALIEAAAACCAAVTVVVAPSRRESIPLDLRVAWLREVHGATPWVRFVGRYDDHPVDYADPAVWDLHCAVFADALGGEPVDAVFSSEAYGEELARRFDAVAVCVDLDRRVVPVSGTAVPRGPGGALASAEPAGAGLAGAPGGGGRGRVHRHHDDGGGARRPLRHRLGPRVRP
ncbi:adenylyltransferase/cytidyltransferase family protein [Micromonospora chersina]|uniref:adenylyltransferase/cytidyltransferase family protein n=1 Tax=Micromonospora chersina TaxID=47854 RepID=UPI0037152F79